MHTLVLIGVLCCGEISEKDLLARLDASYAKLLEDEPSAAEVQRAARLLAETNQRDRWTNYSAATKILRQTRPQAGIPLLLAYMVRHAELSTGHVVIPEYAETLAVLTGKEVANPYRYEADRKAPVLG
ncbi:MAG TPA: hypothetical protein VFV87_08475, partial [Pirellulaceae bacterium]|nr:hypothetical protein [Pirellulaceae bacterium]